MSNVTGPGTAQDRNRLFEQLVDRYQEPVLRMCYRWTITGVTAARKPGS